MSLFSQVKTVSDDTYKATTSDESLKNIAIAGASAVLVVGIAEVVNSIKVAGSVNSTNATTTVNEANNINNVNNLTTANAGINQTSNLSVDLSQFGNYSNTANTLNTVNTVNNLTLFVNNNSKYCIFNLTPIDSLRFFSQP